MRNFKLAFEVLFIGVMCGIIFTLPNLIEAHWYYEYAGSKVALYVTIAQLVLVTFIFYGRLSMRGKCIGILFVGLLTLGESLATFGVSSVVDYRRGVAHEVQYLAYGFVFAWLVGLVGYLFGLCVHQLRGKKGVIGKKGAGLES